MCGAVAQAPPRCSGACANAARDHAEEESVGGRGDAVVSAGAGRRCSSRCSAVASSSSRGGP
eukprot:3048729-Lingulodinium_polyedra.AAC.1